MRRRAFIRAAGSGLLALPFAGRAKDGVAARVGWVAVAPIPSNIAVFRDAMRQRGYTEGENYRIDERYAGSADALARIFADLVRLKADVVVTTGGLASRQAKPASTAVPVVFFTTDPVGSGLVASLARPGGNLTGVAIITQDFNAKRVETIASVVPNLRKLAALDDQSGALGPGLQRAFFAESEAAATRLGIGLAPRLAIRDVDQVDAAFAAAVKAGADAMLTISSSYFNAHKERLVGAAAAVRLPTIYEHRDFVESGGLVSYGPDLREAARLAASYVDRILKGARPAELPVEQVSKVELVVNQKTAKALGLGIPAAVLLRADEVVQ